MHTEARFQSAAPYKDDVLALPVPSLDDASEWYSKHFGMSEVDRDASSTAGASHPRVLLERDGVRIGFAVNGGDASEEGAAIRVSNISAMRDELESRGVKTANWRIDERDGEKLQVFFVIAPDGLCYYFYEPVEAPEEP